MLFKVRQEFALQGSTTDAEDDSGGEPETTPTLEREVLQHQKTATTRFRTSRDRQRPDVTAPAPEGLFSTDLAGNYLEVRLTAADSRGPLKRSFGSYA